MDSYDEYQGEETTWKSFIEMESQLVMQIPY